jgi:hypothetical protein
MTRPTEAEIRARAYEVYLRNGRSAGLDTYNWLTAEQELLEERRGMLVGRA